MLFIRNTSSTKQHQKFEYKEIDISGKFSKEKNVKR